VPFGKKRYYTALVKEVHERVPETPYALKEIFAVLDTTPVMFPRQMLFWDWISSYYLCKLGDVYKAAVPAGLKLESETVVSYCEDFEATAPLPAREQSVLDAFSKRDSLTVAELEKTTGIRNLIPVLNTLVMQGAVTVSEKMKQGFVPKTETCIRLAPGYSREEDLQPVFAQLKRAKQQEHILLHYIDVAQPFHPDISIEISKKKLLKESEAGVSALDALVKRGILVCYEKEISRLRTQTTGLQPLSELTEVQQTAYREIQTVFETKAVCLLHGVPSSGKTEIYLRLISDTLQQGRHVLYLLPEIAITTQITERLAVVFGDKLAVYHSGFSDAERVEVWNKLLHSKEPMVVVGVRSSLFLPYPDLGLVIVDEEQEPSYKQQDPAPRYHARNAAIMLAHIYGGKTLSGSATPSLDSFYNAKTGKYGLVSLKTRHGESLTPQIHLVDVKELRHKKIMKETLFSPLLKEKIGEALAQDEQVILFQNRRGFAPMLECKSCGKTLHCINCDVSLTYHKQLHQMVCHYCGYSVPAPSQCPSCNGKELKLIGFGTEKVEEEIAALFPGVKAERLDLDAARTRRAYEHILSDFEQKKTRILIGTQMVAKGLDFEQVSVVGVLNADGLMNFPDFRAHERAFQLMMQVSGRAGRRHKQGTVVIQTTQPEHPLLQMVQSFDYEGMAYAQLSERKMFRYPPYFRLITMVLRSRDELVLERFSAQYADLLRKALSERVIGPFSPPVNRVQTLHVRKIVLKLELSLPVGSVRGVLDKVYHTMQSVSGFKQVWLHYDVD
ncbi:MAG: primosomal protein N', partial [Tannerella sp.]|nr:primosomal protein N' [Tannerella sp.]